MSNLVALDRKYLVKDRGYLSDVGGTECCECGAEPGACCLDSGACIEITRKQCAQLGGAFVGGPCENADCAEGACCVQDKCFEVTRGGCENIGGRFIGGSCDGVDCLGACCLEDGSCVLTQDEPACEAQGGRFVGGDCADANCARGACCFPEDGSCDFITPTECANRFGQYQGDGVLCSDVTCPRPFGCQDCPTVQTISVSGFAVTCVPGPFSCTLPNGTETPCQAGAATCCVPCQVHLCPNENPPCCTCQNIEGQFLVSKLGAFTQRGHFHSDGRIPWVAEVTWTRVGSVGRGALITAVYSSPPQVCAQGVYSFVFSFGNQKCDPEDPPELCCDFVSSGPITMS